VSIKITSMMPKIVSAQPNHLMPFSLALSEPSGLCYVPGYCIIFKFVVTSVP
jgi:hypothetical protein